MTLKASHSATPFMRPGRQEAPQSACQPCQQADNLTSSNVARAALDAGIPVLASHLQG